MFFNRQEFTNRGFKFIFVRSSQVLIAEVFSIVLDKKAGLVAIMTGSCYIFVCFFTKEIARMIIVAELIAFAVVYEKDAYVVSYVTIANDIHIIEECQITKNTEK